MSEHDRPDPAYVAVYSGVVTDRADPLRIGRVRVRVPGLLEPESDWALPAALPGSGEAQRGLYAVPEVGSDVSVWFTQGDPDHPRYAGAGWGAPRGTPQSPTPVKDRSAEEAPNVHCWETAKFWLAFDDNGDGSVEIRVKSPEHRLKYAGGIWTLEGDGVRLVDPNATQALIKGNARNDADGDFLTALQAWMEVLRIGIAAAGGAIDNTAMTQAIAQYRTAIANALSSAAKTG